METKELIKMLLEEDAYLRDVHIDMNIDGVVEMTVGFIVVPKKTGISRIKLMSGTQYEKLENFFEPIDDELFKL